MTPAPDVRSWTCRLWRVRHTSRRADDSVYAGRHASCARSEPGRAPRRWSLRQTSGAGRADGGVCATRPGEQTTAHALAVTRASHGPSPDVHHDAGACARRQELDVQTVARAPHVQASRVHVMTIDRQQPPTTRVYASQGEICTSDNKTIPEYPPRPACDGCSFGRHVQKTGFSGGSL